jgi:hypothetical protein
MQKESNIRAFEMHPLHFKDFDTRMAQAGKPAPISLVQIGEACCHLVEDGDL